MSLSTSRIMMRSVRRGMKLLSLAVIGYFRQKWLGRFLPSQPTVLYLLVNNVCNSRCVICNIWQQTQADEIGLDQLGTLLTDPLFQKVQQVVLTGGEPTLRVDLPDLGQVLIQSLSKLQGVEVETNALDVQNVLARLTALAEVAAKSDIRFGVKISLDGVGTDHDRNRGVDGSFDAAVSVIQALKKRNIPVAIRATLTPLNCYAADDLLIWCDQNGIRNWAFRLAIESPRFYNQGYAQQYIFSAEQRFHLMMFFEQLIYKRRLPLAQRQFYKRLIEKLQMDKFRPIACTWPDNSITLDMQGQIRCYRNQRISLIPVMEGSARQLYRKLRTNVQERDDCLLEPPEVLPPGEIVGRGKEVIRSLYRQRLNRINLQAISPKIVHPADKNHPSEWQHVLITGWYGTETAGDKAILGEVLYFIKVHAPDCRVTLTTLNRSISMQMQNELADLRGVAQMDITEGYKPALIESVDAVIMGGGPLIESQAMEYIWLIFAEANRQHKARIIFGCGIGPLHTEHITQLTASILQMATAGFFRDLESYNYAARLAPGKTFGYACDPAVAYVRRWVQSQQSECVRRNASKRIVGLLRANTTEFVAEQSKVELQTANQHVAQQLAQILDAASCNTQARVELLHMNAHWIGGDDRLFNRQVAASLETAANVHVERAYLTLDQLLLSLATAEAAVVMRYHGHIFSMALGIPFLSIDYTGKGGKVHGLMRRIGYEGWSEDWYNLDVAGAVARLTELMAEREYWSAYLQEQADNLVMQLRNTYEAVFGVNVHA